MGFIRKYLLCGCACSKSRPQYKKHILQVFPKDDSTAQPQNLSVLVHYALSYPEQLDNIGRYLHKCISRDLKQGQHNAVRVGMVTLNALIDACHSDTQLPQYDSWIIKCTLLLFNHSDIQLRITASETFRKLVHYQDEWSDYRNLDVFFDHLVALCVYEHTDVDVQCETRMAGIRSMRKMIMFTDPQNTVEHLDEIVPAIFHNIKVDSERTEAEGTRMLSDCGSANNGSWQPQETTSPEKLARACLQNIGALATLDFIKFILAPIFKNLDGRLWKSPEFALTCIRIIADSSKVDHGYGICYLLLKHLDSIDLGNDANESKLVDVQIRIAHVLAELILVMRIDIWQGLINFLVQRLEQAVVSGRAQLADALSTCVGSYCIRLPQALDIVHTIAIIVDQVPLEPEEFAIRQTLLKCALHAARLCRYCPDASAPASQMLSKLLKVCQIDIENDSAASQDDEIVIVHEVLVNLAVPFVGSPRSMSALIESGPNQNNDSPQREFGQPPQASAASARKVDEFILRLWSGSRTDDLVPMGDHSNLEAFFSENQYQLIHRSINSHLQDRACPTPKHMTTYFRTMVVLLYLRPYQTLLTSIPLLLSWMDSNPLPPASSDAPLACAQLKASRISVLIATYIQAISRVLALLDSTRAASSLDEIGTKALERALAVSKQEVGLQVDADASLSPAEITVKHRHGIKGRDVHIKDGTAEKDSFLDRVEFLHILSRLQFAGLDARQAREALSAPLEKTSLGKIETDRRPSLSTSEPHFILTRSETEYEPSRSVAETDIDDVRLDVDDSEPSMEQRSAAAAAENFAASPNSQAQSNHKAKPAGRATFHELTTSYLQQHDQRLTSYQLVSGRRRRNIRSEGHDSASVNDDDSESVLSELLASSVGSRDDDSRSMSSNMNPDQPPSPSSDSASRQKSPSIAGLKRQLSRASVLALPDNPQPMLSAQQMLSDLDDRADNSVDLNAAAADEHDPVTASAAAVSPTSTATAAAAAAAVSPTVQRLAAATAASGGAAKRKKKRRSRRARGQNDNNADRTSSSQQPADVSVFSVQYPALSGLQDHDEYDPRDAPASANNSQNFAATL